MQALRRAFWSPYAVGAAIGALSWFAFLTAKRPLGISSAFVRLAAWLEGLVAPAHVEANPYLAKMKPVFDWEFFLVIGVALGALAAARLGGVKNSGERPSGRRIAEAVLGGFFLMIGARIANGCTSGNGISGSLQLALSGWVFFVTIFASGVATALLFKKEAR